MCRIHGRKVIEMNPLINRFYEMGFSIIPTGQDKRPVIQWKEYQTRKATLPELNAWFVNGNNPAVICGAISDNLVIIDCDDPHVSELLQIDTFTVRTPSGGIHLYIKSKVVPEKQQAYRGYALDIQADRAYALLPGSKTDKGEYVIIKDTPIKELDNIIEYLDKKLISVSDNREDEIQTFKKKVGMDIITKWVNFEVTGHNYKQCKCPFHGDSDPSFTVYDSGYYCFGCGEHGDIISFIMKVDNLDFKQAIKKISEMTGVKAPELKRLIPNNSIKNEIKAKGAFEYINRISEKTPVYYDKAGQFWLWNKDGYYDQVDTTEILLTLLRDIADPSIIQKTFKAELIEAAKLLGRDAGVKTIPNNWIHVKNGVYDIKTGNIFDVTPEYLFTQPIPHKISGKEETLTIDKLFNEWVSPEKVTLLYEIAAYCLYNGYPIHRMFVLLGRGRNGKGQYRDLIANLIGHHNQCSSTLEQLINSRFESARLFNKKICTMGEINYTLLDRTAILKMLSGGDPIPGENKNKNPFEFVNTAKLLINTNSLPQTSDKTDAFYSRCVVVEFIKQFPLGKNIIETIPDEEYDNFLTKLLRILKELLDRGEFTNEGDIKQKEKEYERLSNPLTQFINANYEKDVNGVVAAWRIMEEYEGYCELNGFLKPRNNQSFNAQLRVNYEVEKENLFDEAEKKHVCWVWVRGLKKKNLSGLSGLSGFLVSSPYIEPSGKLDKLDKVDKNNLPITEKSYQTLPIIEALKLDNSVTQIKEIEDFKNSSSWNKGEINISNLTEFVMSFCDYSKTDKSPLAIKEIAKKHFNITPGAN